VQIELAETRREYNKPHNGEVPQSVRISLDELKGAGR
jgi:hypothetical protein